MPKMTEEEACALDDFSADYLLSVSAASHKTPSEIIAEMVREKAAVSW
jgi:hypothetical protein